MARTAALQAFAVKANRKISSIPAGQPSTPTKWFGSLHDGATTNQCPIEIKSRQIESAEERLLAALAAVTQSSMVLIDEQPRLALP